MTPEELLSLVGNLEDNYIERKPDNVNVRELRQTLGAFANTVPDGREAVLFIGVHDKTGELLGVENPEATQKRVREVCRDDCYPPVRHESIVLHVGGRPIVAVVIPFSNERPHFTGPAFVRAGAESVKASARQYEELILSRVDKARDILRHKDKVFTILGVGYRIGSNKYLADAGFREMRECRVLECSGSLVTLRDINGDQKISEPLGRVEFTYDHERSDRPMLVVTFPKG
jgi:hypothetical protein